MVHYLPFKNTNLLLIFLLNQLKFIACQSRKEFDPVWLEKQKFVSQKFIE